MGKTIVILGAGIAGLPLAHYLLRHEVPKFPDLRVILVSPTDEFYWAFATPRAVIPGKFTEDDISRSIPKAFTKYPSDKFELVLGKATQLLPNENAVIVSLNNGSQRRVEYHTVVVATGADDKQKLPWKNVGTSAETRKGLAQLRRSIADADTIVVGGAGITGVELAGELGSEYGSKRVKKIILVSTGALPMDSTMLDSVRKVTKLELEKLNVKIISDSRVSKVTDTEKGQLIELSKTDGTTETIRADLFIPAYGLVYNTDFVPPTMRDESGRLHQDTCLRVPGYKNIFVVGDAGNLEYPTGRYANDQVHHLTKQFESYLRTGALGAYNTDKKFMAAITIGPSRGTGQVGNWKVWSIIVWWLKCRYMGLNYVAAYMEGTGNMSGKWKK